MTDSTSEAHGLKSIPKPSFPGPRRRSSIAQAAAANQDATPGPPQPLAVSDAADQAEQGFSSVGAPPATSPVAIEPAPATQVPASPAPAARPSAPARSRSSRSVTPVSAAPKRPEASKDILLSIPEDAKNRMVNTITWTQPHTGIGQQQKFIRRAISDLCDRLEHDFNGGAPFPAPATPNE